MEWISKYLCIQVVEEDKVSGSSILTADASMSNLRLQAWLLLLLLVVVVL